jgi:5-methylcytosine-specific restriction endonuclease McrA
VSTPYISENVKTRVREAAKNRCGYCRSLQKYVLGVLEIEYIIPKASGGNDNEENLWLSCRLCNSYKGVQTKATDPISDQTVGTGSTAWEIEKVAEKGIQELGDQAKY